jgi:ADP-heptose:LPS heptosyltransferase
VAKTPLVLKHTLALGDTICFTAIVRDIALNYPGQYDVAVVSHFREIWDNNPYARIFRPGDISARTKPIELSYASKKSRNFIRESTRGTKLHMLTSYQRHLQELTGINAPLRLPKGDIHFTEKEKQPIISGRYWLMLPGGKLDMTNKIWWASRYQEVVNVLGKLGIQCVQMGVNHRKHINPKLTGALDMVGKFNSARDFLNMVYHSDGVICPITSGMHAAACFDKPCVVLAGGREEPWWEAYADTYGAFGPLCAPVKMPHRFLHTMGALHCCKTRGCWKKRTVPLDAKDHGENRGQICIEPVAADGKHAALCMDMITVDHVVEAVMSYYKDGSIPPIGQPKKTYAHLGKDAEPKKLEEPDLLPIDQLGRIENPAPLKIMRNADVPRPAPVKPVVAAPKAPPPQNLRLIDNPIIGGKFTVCVLCYGPYPELAKKCITSIVESVPAERLDLRVACNEVSQETLQFLKTMPITRTYINEKNRKKYPVMREMLHDKTCPIDTNYVLWFDDDTQIVDPNWMVRLTEVIVGNHSQGCRMFGVRMIHDLKAYAKNGNRPDRWFKEASWYQGRNFRVRRHNTEAPNGTIIEFAVGWFWALAMETVRRGDIPDVRLNHNGGDITIGEQVHQAGGKIKMFNKGKVFVWCPTKEQGGRRGFEERFPWTAQRMAGAQ